MLRTALVFLILIPGAVAALFNRFAGLLLYIWFALFRPQEWLWFDVSAFRLSLVVGVLLVVPSLLTGVFPDFTHPLSVGAIAFLGLGLLAQINAVRPDIGWEWLDFLARLVLVCLLAVRLITDKRRFVLALAVVAGSFGFHSAKAGLGFLVGGGVRFGVGVAGAFPDNEGYALGTVMILPLLVFAGQNLPWRWLRVAFFAAVPLSVLTVIGTFSRGGLLGLVGAVLTLVIFQRRRVAALAGVAVAVLLLVTVVPIPQGYFERMETIRTFEEVGDSSALGRLHFWRVAMDMVAAHPLGIGLHNFQSAYDAYDFSNGQYGTSRAVHNSNFEVLAETGYLGIAVWTGLFAFALLVCLRVRARARRADLADDDRRFLMTAANALIASMIGFLIGGSFIALALNDLTWLTFAFVAALDRISKVMVSERPLAAEAHLDSEPQFVFAAAPRVRA